MTKHIPLFCAIAVGSTIIAGTARAEGPSQQDKQFIAAAASGGRLEVRLGEYASQNAASGDVKEFAEHMVDDHSKANNQLETIASRQPIDIPRALSAEDQGVLDRLEKLKGAEFDKAYVAQMVEDHRKDVAAFEKERDRGSDIAVKGFAENTLPVLKRHLELVEKLNKAINKSV